MYVPKSSKFRFENMWIKEDQCLKLVKESWEATVERIIMEKVEFVCLKLEEYGGGKLKYTQVKMQGYRKHMRIFRSRRDSYGVKKYNEARWEYM